MVEFITNNENSVNNMGILSGDYLFNLRSIHLIDIIISTNHTIDLTNNSLELEQSFIRNNGYMSIQAEPTLCQAHNISMNKLQLIYMLKKWLVYNIDIVPIEESYSIEELVINIDRSSTIQDILNTVTLTKCVLECLDIYLVRAN